MSSNVMKTRRPEPAEIDYKNMRFLIMDRPTDASMDRFIEVKDFMHFITRNKFTPYSL